MRNNKAYDKTLDWANKHLGAIRAFAIIAVVILAVAIIASGSGGKDDNQTQTTQYSISESAAEEYCQDAELLGKYINLENYGVIKITNYNKQFGDFGGWYDSDGKDILYLRWNGENKLANQEARFDCWISGTDEDIRLHKLSVDDIVLYDTSTITIVDGSGARVFATE